MKSEGSVEPLKSFDEFYHDLPSTTHAQIRAKAHSKIESPEAFEDQKQHLLGLYRGVEVQHTFVDGSGQIFDCVAIDKQPALMKSGRPLAAPPKSPAQKSSSGQAISNFEFLKADRKDRYGNVMACPTGTVPVRRVTLEEMGRFKNLEQFLRKGPRNDRPRPSQLYLPPVDADGSEPPHEYAHALQTVANVGGHSILNVWSPTVSGNQIFSLSQQWYVATAEKGLQTAEVGWQVYPQKYGHSNPVLFTYWTADGYNSTGSYSNDAGDFVQYSSTCPVGIALGQVSISGGVQAEIELSYVLSGGNWWLFVNGNDSAHAVGYYPVELYQNGPMATGATEVDFGGETVGNGSYPPMGSGAFAAEGNLKAAYHRNITYFPLGTGVQDAKLDSREDWPNSYTIETANSTDWGEYFFFGGPGNTAQPSLVPIHRAIDSQIVSVAKPVSIAMRAVSGSKWRWALLTLAFVVALITCGVLIAEGAWAQSTEHIHAEWLAVEGTLLGLCIFAGYIVNKRPEGVLIDEQNRISLARVQWVAWFVILLGGFFTESIWNVAAGWNDAVKGSFPDMQPELYALLGIVGGSAVVAGVINNGKINALNAPVPPTNPSIGIPTNRGLLDSNVDPSEASWADLYLGGEVSNRNVVDVSRLQKLVITVLLIMTYIQMLWTNLANDLAPDAHEHVSKLAHFSMMPQIGQSAVWLLGISHAAYLASKASPKSPTVQLTQQENPAIAGGARDRRVDHV